MALRYAVGRTVKAKRGSPSFFRASLWITRAPVSATDLESGCRQDAPGAGAGD